MVDPTPLSPQAPAVGGFAPSREVPQQQVTDLTQALQQLLIHLETVRDDERRRIARELHDGLGQQVSSVALALDVLQPLLAGDLARAQAARLRALVQQLDRELDRVVFVLRPSALEGCALGEGVAAYVQAWSALTGVAVDLELQGLDGEPLPAAVETAVFRVVQEALTNVARHARAQRVSVSLARRGRVLIGSVEDDGQGFDPADHAASAAGRSHWGLLGMRERIEALGGSFAVESRPGQGTGVLCRVAVG
jgi:signal transduction histidine kinase